MPGSQTIHSRSMRQPYRRSRWATIASSQRVGRERVAEDPVGDARLERLDHRRRRGEVHVGDPEGQHVVAVEVPLEAGGAPALDGGVEVEVHAQRLADRPATGGTRGGRPAVCPRRSGRSPLARLCICRILLIAFSRAAKAWERQRALQYLRRGFVVTNGAPHWKQCRSISADSSRRRRTTALALVQRASSTKGCIRTGRWCNPARRTPCPHCRSAPGRSCRPDAGGRPAAPGIDIHIDHSALVALCLIGAPGAAHPQGGGRQMPRRDRMVLSRAVPFRAALVHTKTVSVLYAVPCRLCHRGSRVSSIP